MQVQINYFDDSSFTVEEIINLAKHNYGDNVKIKIEADSPAPHDLIYFAIQQIVTYRQLSALFDDKDKYSVKLKEIRSDTIQKLVEILDTVIIDNESKVS